MTGRYAAVCASLAICAVMPSAARAEWRAEPMPPTDGLQLLDLSFDGRGQALLASEGFEQTGGRRFTAVRVRDPAGGWQTAPDLADLTWGDAQIHLYGRTRALLVARQAAATNGIGASRQRLVYAAGRSDGTFPGLRTTAEDAAEHASAANGIGEALVAFRDRSGRLFVAERSARRSFGPARRLGPGGSAAAAINNAGRRLIAWWDADGVHARIRDRRGPWSRPVRLARTRPFYDAKIRATVTPRGRIVVVWHTADVGEDRPFDIVAGVAVRSRRSGWRSHGLERSRPTGGPYLAGAPAIPLVDSTGRIYVTWTGIARGAPVVKLARITAHGARQRTVLSGPVTGAAVDDAAAGPDGSLAVSWSAMSDYRTTITYVSLRRSDAPFAAPVRLTPDGVLGLTGSRVAFQPITGEAVAAARYVKPGGTAALQAFVG